MDDLFSATQKKQAPLADRMRPRTLDDFLGQPHLVGRGKLLRRAIEADRLQSCIFFGPPGTGKTTLASIIAGQTRAAYEKLNAVTSGVADLRTVIAAADERLRLHGRATYLVLDECHRWNKAQSDCILPALEQGTVRFIGTTTENPMIAMTPAIVSRCRIFAFERLSDADVVHAMRQALADEERGLFSLRVEADEAALAHIAQVAGGDARSALGALELAALSTQPDADGVIRITPEVAADSIQQRALPMDASMMYDILSAFCKSLRGSDSDAALFWFQRMLYAGVDPRIPVRRLIVHASEDVGLANPNALLMATAALQALEFIGMPEAGIPITQAIIYLCESAKSNSVVAAMGAAQALAASAPNQPVPVHLRDTSYQGYERIGSGVGYKYPHDFPGHWVKQRYLPEGVGDAPIYEPSDQGAEATIRERWKKRRGIE